MAGVRKRIAFICLTEQPKSDRELHSVGASGTVSSVLWLAMGLAERGHEPHLIYSHDCVSWKGVTCHVASDSSIARKLSEIGPDAVVVVGHSRPVLDAERLAGTKVYYWAHNWVDAPSLMKLIDGKKLDAVICVSDYQRRRFFSTVRFSRRFYESSYSIPNALDVASIPSKQDYTIGDRLRVAYVGFPSKHKGFPDACKAVLDLNERGVKATLTVYGSSGLYGQVEGTEADNCCYVRDLDRLGLIAFRGTIGRYELYSDLVKQDVVLGGLTGSETFSVSIAEALAAGVPVVTSCCGGQTDYVINGRSGFLVGTVHGAVDRLVDFAHMTPSDKALMGSFGRAAAAQFEYKRVCSIWENVLTKHQNATTFGPAGYVAEIARSIMLRMRF